MIAVLDSNLGGLPLVRELHRSWPEAQIFYLADTASGIMGNRSPTFIRERLQSHLDYLAVRQPKLIVVASHSMGDALLANPGLFAHRGIPVLNIVSLTATAAVQASTKGAIGYVSGRAVFDSQCYERLVRCDLPHARIYGRACPVLSGLAHEMWHKKPESAMSVKKCLHPLKTRQVDTLIVASSDFSGLLPLIKRKQGGRIVLIDPLSAIRTAAASCLGAARKTDSEPDMQNLTLAATDVTPHLERLAKSLFGYNLCLAPMG